MYRQVKSKTDSVRTPPALLKKIKAEFGKLYDPVPYKPNFNPKTHKDALTTEWKAVNYVNPPYSKMAAFVEKAHDEWKKGKTIIMLCKIENLATQYAPKFIKGKAEVRVFTERLAFPGYKKAAKFFSILVIWRAKKRSSKLGFIGVPT